MKRLKDYIIIVSRCRKRKKQHQFALLNRCVPRVAQQKSVCVIIRRVCMACIALLGNSRVLALPVRASLEPVVYVAMTFTLYSVPLIRFKISMVFTSSPTNVSRARPGTAHTYTHRNTHNDATWHTQTQLKTSTLKQTSGHVSHLVLKSCKSFS